MLEMEPFELDEYFYSCKEYLYEGLITSYDAKTVIYHLHKIKIFNTRIKKNRIIITLFTNKEKETLLNSLNKINDILKISGWFASKLNNFKNKEKIVLKNIHQIKKYVIDNDIVYTISLEPKFDIEIDKDELPKCLYHTTLSIYHNKIITKGLIPKGKSKISKHPDRIYLCKNIKLCQDLISHLSKYVTQKIKTRFYPKYITFNIYEIETESLNMKFFEDCNLDNALYVLDNISKNKIKLFKTVNFKK